MEYGAGSAAAGSGAGGGLSIFVAAEGPDGGGSCPADFIISVPATAMATIAAIALAILTMFQPRSVLLPLPSRRVRAASSSPAVCGRFAGSLDSALSTASTNVVERSGRASRSRFTWPVRCAFSIANRSMPFTG